MQKNTEKINYVLERKSTSLSTGFFDGIPQNIKDLNQILKYIEINPFDDFIRRHALRLLSEADTEKLIRLLNDKNEYISALALEFLIINKKNEKFKNIDFKNSDLENLKTKTSLIYIKADLIKEQNLLWDEFKKICKINLESHKALSSLGINKFKKLNKKRNDLSHKEADIESICKIVREKYKPLNFTLEDTIAKAENLLSKYKVYTDIEMRHEASLSPVALQRTWDLSLSINNKRLNYSLKGEMTSYGKGLTLENARATLNMEIVERYASFASFRGNEILNRKNNKEILFGSYTDLINRSFNVLDPNNLSLEVPYENEEIHWMWGELSKGKNKKILVPVQSVFLFCNLDEPSLFSSLGSTGLASGNTMEQAKVSAILEAVERDNEATNPYDKSKCFELASSHEYVSQLLKSYKERDVHVQFQDLTGSNGIPCCKAFVKGVDGMIAKGTCAKLNAQKAIISAITEIPWPYPNSPSTLQGIEGLPIVGFENLPDYSTGNPQGDLEILEKLLNENGYNPVYVELTRDDVDLPVVKAIIPGFEWSADIDQYSVISTRFIEKAFEAQVH